jgi:uncharacterized repeat protein (TIGR01451 family)
MTFLASPLRTAFRSFLALTGKSTRPSAEHAGTRLAALVLSMVIALVACSADAQAQTVLFQESFGSVVGTLPTALSDADAPYNNSTPACVNGQIRATGGAPGDVGTGYLFHNTGTCSNASYTATRAWFNITPIPVTANTPYRFAYQVMQYGTTSPVIPSQTVTPNVGGSVTTTPQPSPPALANQVWVKRYVDFTTGPDTTSVTLAIRNGRSGGGGNDFGLDAFILYDMSPAVTVKKTAHLNDLNDNDLLDPGETIAYQFVVTNTGPVALTGVTVDDPLLTVNEAPQTLAPGAKYTFTATYTPTQAEIDAGKVSNTATARATPPSGPEITSPPDTAVVTANAVPSMTLVKTGTDANDNGVLDEGETIDFEFLVTNTGTVTLTGVTVDDPLVTVNEPPQTLLPGASFTFTATYQSTADDFEAGSVRNTATATGKPPSGPDIVSPPDTAVVPSSPASLEVVKTAVFNDLDGDGLASVGDTITYTVEVTNTGGQRATDVAPIDAGPTFNGQPAAGVLSAFVPASVSLRPNGSQSFVATYVLTLADIENAGGVVDGVANTATARGQSEGIDVPANTSAAKVSLPAATPPAISLTKTAELPRIRRGETAPFVIRVKNSSSTDAGSITVTDTLPTGFRYVDGSATIDGAAATPVVNGTSVRFENIALGANAEVVIRLEVLALSAAAPGQHINRANATGPAGEKLAPEATATIEILGEAVFECSTIIGTVFDDFDHNGYQDQGEPGLPGVRLATVNGELITADAHGRFHVPCASLPDGRIGSNYILKLDERTLPVGYRLTTENPRVVRTTAGKMTGINFGAARDRVVGLSLTDAAFVAKAETLKPEWLAGVDQLIDVLRAEPSTLQLTYASQDAGSALAHRRLAATERLIRERWKHQQGASRLDIELRLETGK